MKKRILLLSGCFVVIVLVVGGLCIYFNSPSKELYDLNVGIFNFDEYQYYVDSFPSTRVISDTSNIETIVKETDKIWVAEYGRDIRKQMPYKVFFDPDRNVWLIRGSFNVGELGGVANILIDKNSGDVLAVWHSK